MLYKLNPKLQRNTRDVVSRKINIDEEIDDDISENYSREYAFVKNTQPKKNKIVTPKLNLQNIKKNF